MRPVPGQGVFFKNSVEDGLEVEHAYPGLARTLRSFGDIGGLALSPVL